MRAARHRRLSAPGTLNPSGRWDVLSAAAVRHPVVAAGAATGLLAAILGLLAMTAAIFTAGTTNPVSVLSAGQLNAYVPTAVTATRTAVTTCLVSWTPAGSPPAGLSYDVTDGTSTVATAVPGTSTTITVPAAAVTPAVKARLNAWTSPNATAAAPPCHGYPGAPAVVATPGDGQILVSWTAPAGNGGTVSSYAVTASPGSAACSTTAPTASCTLTGLTNGISYTVSVTATSNVGTGPAGTATAIPYPASIMTSSTLGAWYDAATASTLLNASGTTATSGQPVATWKDRSAAGMDVTQATAGNRGTLTTMNGLPAWASTSSTYLTSTASGSFRTVFAVADNDRSALWGTTFASPANTDYSQRFQNGALPTSGNVNDWHTTTALQWTNSVKQGSAVGTTGPAIYVSQAPSTRTGTASLSTGFTNSGGRGLVGSLGEVIVVNGTLDGGTITDANRRVIEEYLARKWGVAVTPSAPAATAAAGDTQATMSWTPPWNGGSAITGYTATATPTDGTLATVTQACASSPCTVTGLTNGGIYALTLTATNAVGTGPASTAVSVEARPALMVSSDAQLWLDGFDPDGDGVVAGAAENCDTATTCAAASNRLTRWKDKSGNARDALQATPAMAGTLTPATGLVTFTGNGYYQASSVPVGPDVTAFAVASSAVTPYNTWGWLAGSRSANGWMFHPNISATTTTFFGIKNTTYNDQTTVTAGVSPSSAITVPHVWDGQIAGTSTQTLNLATDGNLGATVTNATARAAGSVTLTIGADDLDLANRRGNGSIREIAVFNRALTDTERRTVREYLARRWGVPITSRAPGTPTVTAGDGQATLTWTAPSWNGGSAVTGYTATAVPASTTTTSTLPTVTQACASSPCTLTGLTNGATYAVTVAALNTFGTGPASSSASVTPRPALLVGGSSVLWLDGADAATLYAASSCSGAAASTAVGCWKDKSPSANHATQSTGGSRPGLTTVAGRAVPGFDGSTTFLSLTPALLPTGTTSSTEFVVASLADATPTATGYRNVLDWGGTGTGQARSLFKVGNAATAGFDARFTSSSTPGAWSTSGPTLIAAEAAGAGTTLRTAMSGAPWTSATNVSFSTGTTAAYVGQNVAAGSLWNGSISEELVFSGTLTAADRRTVEEYLSRKWAVTITPQAPTAVTGVPGSASVAVSWTAPAWDGGTTVTGYTVTASPGGATCTTASTSCTVSGLTNGTAYTFTVTATSTAGAGPASSASASLTPAAPQLLYATGDSAAGQGGAGVTTFSPAQTGSATTWAVVDAGWNHECGTRTDGTLWCWGYNGLSQLGTGDTTARATPTQIGAVTTWTSVAAGFSHSCATRSNGTLWCWGYNGNGQLGVGDTTDRTTPTQVGVVSTWSSVSATGDHTCATRTDGTLWCWGYNVYGQLGVGNTTNRTSPTQVGAATTWTSIGAGFNHTCATRTNGTLWCWGYNAYGQLGLGDTTNRTSAVQIGTGTTWATASAGGYHSCATRTDGTLWCWGQNSYGDLGVGDTTDRSSPAQAGSGTTWATVAAGHIHTCATRTNGTLWCWGYNGTGAAGTGDDVNRTSPTQAGTATTWSSVTAGNGHACATGTDGTLWCWGDNTYGQLGRATATTGFTQAGSATTWASVSAGTEHACAIRTDGTLWCWGHNLNGQLGTADTASRAAPTQVGTATSWTSVSAGGDHTCGIRSPGTLWCWGYNGYGDLGVGDTTDRTSPTQVGAVTTWSAVSADGDHTCALRTAGTAWCWGFNGAGQLGVGDTTDRTSPTQVGAVTTYASVSAGTSHSCATRTDGTLWCWGSNADGQLGNGSNTSRTTPGQSGAVTTWATVSAGGSHSCATRTNGTLWCWGLAGNGQLGNGSTSDRTSPTQAGAATTWSTVTTGTAHTCALRTDKTAWCWGANASGQLGLGDTTNRTSATQVGAATSWLGIAAGDSFTVGVS